jgi:hypothetical protein
LPDKEAGVDNPELVQLSPLGQRVNKNVEIPDL